MACPPASRPRCELRSARRLEARPGPAGLAAASNRSGLVVSVLPRQAPPRPHRPASALAHVAAELLNFACNSPATISNIEFTALKLQRFQTLLNLHLNELHATFEEAQAPPWPVCIGNLSRETGVAFARVGRAPIETAVAFARVGRASDETAIAFAGEKWAFWVRFSVAEVMVVSRWPASAVAEVMVVSMVAVWGRAVVPTVSCWPASVVAEVSLVSTSPRHSCLCAKKFALLGLMVGVSAKKFAQRTKNGPKSAVCGVPGEVFRG